MHISVNTFIALTFIMELYQRNLKKKALSDSVREIYIRENRFTFLTRLHFLPYPKAKASALINYCREKRNKNISSIFKLEEKNKHSF